MAHEGRKERGENEEEGEEGRMEEVHTERHRERQKERADGTLRDREVSPAGGHEQKQRREEERASAMGVGQARQGKAYLFGGNWKDMSDVHGRDR